MNIERKTIPMQGLLAGFRARPKEVAPQKDYIDHAIENLEVKMEITIPYSMKRDVRSLMTNPELVGGGLCRYIHSGAWIEIKPEDGVPSEVIPVYELNKEAIEQRLEYFNLQG